MISKLQNVDGILHVGDRWHYGGPVDIPTWGIHGNHEDFYNLNTGHGYTGKLLMMAPWSTKEFDGISIGFVGGIWAGGYNWQNAETMGLHWYLDNRHSMKVNNIRNRFPFWIDETDGAFHSNPMVVISHDRPLTTGVKEVKGEGASKYNPLEAALRYHKPKLWFHGHLHQHDDYTIDKTRVISLPPCDKNVDSVIYCILDTDTMEVGTHYFFEPRAWYG